MTKDTTTKDDTNRIIDLDAKRAARAEARKADDYEPIVLKIGGRDYVLPDEMPADFADLVSQGKFYEGFQVLLGDEFDDFWSNDLTVNDLKDFADMLAPAYGVGGDAGNSLASGSSSRKTGRR